MDVSLIPWWGSVFLRDRPQVSWIHLEEHSGSVCRLLLSAVLSFQYCYEAVTSAWCRLLLKCDGTCAETRFRLSAKRTSPFKSVGASVQSITGSRGVRISGSNAGYTIFRGSVKGTGYPLHSPASPSPSLPCVTVCHHISTGLYLVLLQKQAVL